MRARVSGISGRKGDDLDLMAGEDAECFVAWHVRRQMPVCSCVHVIARQRVACMQMDGARLSVRIPSLSDFRDKEKSGEPDG